MSLPISPANSVLNNAKFLIYANATTFSLSALGQAYAAMNNKNLPQEDRKFIATQQVVKGALDLGVFFLLASSFKKFGKALVAKGKLLPEKINSYRLDKRTGELISERTFTDRREIKALMDAYLSRDLKGHNGNVEKCSPDLKRHINSAENWTAYIGTILAFNVITPIMKNVIANRINKFKQNKKAQKEGQLLPMGNMAEKFKHFSSPHIENKGAKNNSKFA